MKNKEITIYELIGLIKDGKAPMTIYYGGNKYCRTDNNYRHEEITDDGDEDWNLFDSTSLDSFFLDDTVEILPEENDEWEDIDPLQEEGNFKFYNKPTGMSEEVAKILDAYFETLIAKINELIKNQKYLKEKLQNKD